MIRFIQLYQIQVHRKAGGRLQRLGSPCEEESEHEGTEALSLIDHQIQAPFLLSLFVCMQTVWWPYRTVLSTTNFKIDPIPRQPIEITSEMHNDSSPSLRVVAGIKLSFPDTTLTPTSVLSEKYQPCTTTVEKLQQPSQVYEPQSYHRKWIGNIRE